MPKFKKNPTNSALSKWEKAGGKLATALSVYLQSCIFLDRFASTTNPEAKDMAARIDDSLENLHTKLFDELTQSRTALAQMRNKISSRSYSLPNEVLAEIFKLVVYTPGPEDRHYQSMVDGLKRIYGRLHSLLGVCSTWRNVVISLYELWSVIPAADRQSKLLTPSATSLSIERSQALTSTNRQTHLAVVLSEPHALYPPLKKTVVPRLTSINIEARFSGAYAISSLLEKLLATQALETLSELSLYQNFGGIEAPKKARIPHDSEILGRHMTIANRAHFGSLIRSLSILRLRSANIDWSTITFSNKLVHIHLQHLVLGNHSKLNGFLQVLESAPELRELKMISVVVFKTRNVPVVKISLPKLQSLLLDDLSLNTLQHVLTSIPPGSHQLKVGLTEKSLSNRSMDEDSEDEYDYELQMEVEAEFGFDQDFGSKELLSLLNRSNIDTLFLDTRFHQSDRIKRRWLRSILKSLPGLKNLVMSHWKWGFEDFLVLKRPDNAVFPTLTGLYIVNSFIWDESLIPHVVASHSLQTLVMEQGCFMDDNSPILRRLKQQVPDFRLVMGIRYMFNFNDEQWQLW